MSEIVLSMTARWEGEWPDEILTGYLYRGKTLRPVLASLEVRRTTNFRGEPVVSVMALASGAVLKKDGLPGETRTDIQWKSGRFPTDKKWADRPAWLAELADPLVAEMLEIEAFGLEKAELEEIA